MSNESTNLLTAAALLVALSVTAGAPAAAQQADADGTRRMAARLAELHRTTDLRFNTFANGRRLQMVSSFPEPPSPRDQVGYLFMKGREQLLAGFSAEAVESYERILKLISETEGLPFDANAVRNMRDSLALAYLRLGEQENCVAQHNIDRCLMPIREAGVHSETRGSRAAIEVYTQLLRQSPGDLGHRWLLNIAYMTLGEYPGKVPPEWRIPPAAFESDAELPRFYDVAPRLGLDVFGLSGGSIMDDFDRDGYLDIMASAFGLDEQIRLFVNNRDGTFSDRTEEAGLTGITGGLNIIQADVDNDGWLDVLVLRGAWLQEAGRHPNSLLKNLGVGAGGGVSFADVTEEAGLLTLHPTQTAAWGDYDDDGWIDLFIGNESVNESVHPVELFHNDGPGDDGKVTFTEVSRQAGIDLAAYVKGTAWGDVDNDGRIDLYVSVLGARNFLYHNRGPRAGGGWSFAEVAMTAGVTEPVSSFPTWMWDYDNDGWLDIFVSGYRGSIADVAAEYLGKPYPNAEIPRLYRNAGSGEVAFSEVARDSGLDTILMTMGTNFGDLDSDGFLDFYAGTGDTELKSLMPNRMFLNVGGRRFQDVTTAGGFGHLQKGHGVAFGDLDHDGDQDVYAVMGGAHSGDGFYNVLFENPGNGNRWIGLDLEGVAANRAAIGARIEVKVRAGGTADDVAERSIYATVGSGGSFGASSLREEIGLGDAAGIVAVEIAWPGGTEVQRIEDLGLDRFYRIRQGDAEAVLLDLKSFELGGANGGEAGHVHPE
ncbi:MAG: CRTAC1 family protein [Thermoanaerobaculia bacterium]